MKLLVLFALSTAAAAGSASARARLEIPPIPAATTSQEPGVLELGEGAVAVIPVRVDPRRPAPLLLLMHGGGGTAASLFRPFLEDARRHGIVLLGLKSQRLTWDAVEARVPPQNGGSRLGRARAFRLDPPRIERALGRILARMPIDRRRIGIAGFSDGASYALSIGTANPQLFSAILAFSPGMGIFPGGFGPGQPVYVSHARNDPVLDYRLTSTEIVPRLKSARLAVTFRTFDGGHALPPEIRSEGLAVFLSAERPDRGTSR